MSARMVRVADWLREALVFNEVAVVRALVEENPGVPRTLVDVGAHSGTSCLGYLKVGWRVLAFEPDPANRRLLEENTSGLEAIVIDPRAVGSPSGARVPLFTSSISSGISSLHPFHPSHVASVMTELVELRDAIPEWLGGDGLGVLKTDLEGLDLPALLTYDFDPKPTVVIAEFEDRKTIRLKYTSRDLYDFLAGQGYFVLVSEWYPISEYGREHKWRRLLSSPLNLDPLAWGNFVAIDPRFADALKGVFRDAILRHRIVSPLLRLRPSAR